MKTKNKINKMKIKGKENKIKTKSIIHNSDTQSYSIIKAYRICFYNSAIFYYFLQSLNLTTTFIIFYLLLRVISFSF